MKYLYAVAALSVLATTSHAQNGMHMVGKTSVGAAVTKEHLSNGSPDWRESALQLHHEFSRHHVLGLSAVETYRFGLQDNQFNAFYARPLTGNLSGTFEASVSPTHRVLSHNALGATLQYEFAPAWLLHAGGKTVDYDEVKVNQATLMLEHYFSSFSWSAAWRPARAFGVIAHSADLRATYYYDDKSSVGAIVAGGREATNIAGNVVLADVRSFAVIGHHWLNSAWTLSYAVAHTRQGDFYIRNGINLGVRYTF